MPLKSPARRLHREKMALQIVVAIACLVPLLAGIVGIWSGTAFLSEPVAHTNLGLDSHFRYLSGLLFGVGVVFAASIPRIERHAARFRILTLIVVTGGLARLLGVFLSGLPSLPVIGALTMELAVTPLLCLWQNTIARKFAMVLNMPQVPSKKPPVELQDA